MKWSFATIGIFILGLIGVTIILLFQQVTTNNENDYYLLKEVTEAAMIDAIDIPLYRETGTLRIVKAKFIENFARRFAESTLYITDKYTIDYYDIIETPPKVSVVINTGLGQITAGGSTDDYNIKNRLDAILEYTGANTYSKPGSSTYNNPYESKTVTLTYYGIPSVDGTKYSLKTPSQLIVNNIKNIKIKSISNIKAIDSKAAGSQGELNMALLKRELSYNNLSKIDNQYFRSIKDFSNGTVVKNEFYNCGRSTNDYNCNEENKYYVSFEVSNAKMIFKYDVVWSYDEYGFNN